MVGRTRVSSHLTFHSLLTCYKLSDALINDGRTPDVSFILADIVEPKAPRNVQAATIKADLTSPEEIDKLFHTERGVPDAIYCLHGIMSRGSEDNFELGLKVNPPLSALLKTSLTEWFRSTSTQ